MKHLKNLILLALAASVAFAPLAGCQSGAENEQEDVQDAQKKLNEEKADAAKED